MKLEVIEADITRLENLERIITHGRRKQREGYAALKEINDSKLFVAGGYKTFESYCQQMWGMSRQRAYQILAFVEFTTRMSDLIDTSDLSESACRSLIAKGDDEASEILEKASDMASEQERPSVTASLVNKAAKILSPQRGVTMSTLVDSTNGGVAKPAPVTPPPALSDEKVQTAKRHALEGIAKVKKYCGQLGILGKEFDLMLNLMEDRLERL